MLLLDGISGLGDLGYGPSGLAHFNAPAMNKGIVTGPSIAANPSAAPPAVQADGSLVYGVTAPRGMSMTKKLLLALAVLVPVGYVGYRFVKRSKGSTS